MIKDLLKGSITQQELLNYYNANVTYVSLSKGINGFVFNHRGIYNIIINSNLSYYKKRKSILHELAHIELSHLDQDKTMLEFNRNGYEDEADKYIKFIKDNLRNKEREVKYE